MNENDENIFQSLIAGGLIGAALGALLSKDKEEGATIGALAGAVILATYKANEHAQKTNLGVYVEEDGKLYEIQPGGVKRFIKDIPKPNVPLHDHFKLK
jgi:hypothetical protein